MINIRRSSDRGFADHGWLKSAHSFSFASFHDPRYMGFGNLRVINEDRVAAGGGFGTHGHRDMEIVSYVLEGELAHKDSMGTGGEGAGAGGIIRPGDVQRMSAGRGVMHSEFNHGADTTAHFLQIWIEPNVRGIEPSYEQKHFDAAAKRGQLRLVASPDGRDGSLTLHADASIAAGLFDADEQVAVPLEPARKTWVQVVRGKVRVNGTSLEPAMPSACKETELRIDHGEQAEVLVFDLA